jgi:transcriptional regulator with XRE-family HTH domain
MAKGMFVTHNLREWRKFAGLTQEGLAERIDKCTATVFRYENDISGIPGRVLERIADVLNTTPGAIYDAPPRKRH